MNVDELIKKEYNRRKDSGYLESKEDKISLVEKRLERKLEEKFDDLPKKFYKDLIAPLKEEKQKVFVEMKYNGFRAMIHKKGDCVKIFSEDGTDITFPFPNIVNQAKKLSVKDFIIDCDVVIYNNNVPLGKKYALSYIDNAKRDTDINDSNIIFYVSDLLYLGKPVITLELYERKTLLDVFSYTDNIKSSQFIVINNRIGLKEAINRLIKPKESCGVVLKMFEGVYSPSRESTTWVDYALKIPVDFVVVDETFKNKDKQLVKYQIGVYLSDKEKSRIDQTYLTKLGGRNVLMLGETNETDIRAERGDIITTTIDELSRHKKANRYYYDINNTIVRKKISETDSSKIDYLEEIVSKNGYDVIDNEFEVKENKDKEMITNFPSRMKNNFLKVDGNWKPYSVHWHYRGHRISPNERSTESIDEKYEYKLDSLHADVHHLVHGDYLEGMTVLSPTSTDPKIDDNFDKCDEAREGRLRVILKVIEPSGWLNIRGISDIGEAGSTPNAPAIYALVSKGKYRVLESTDHTLKIEYNSERGKVDMKPFKDAEKSGIFIDRKPRDNLKDLTGVWQYQMSHIGDEHIVLLRLLNEKKTKELDEDVIENIKSFCEKTKQLNEEQCKDIVNLTFDGELFRPEIAKKFNVDTNLVYRLQKNCKIV